MNTRIALALVAGAACMANADVIVNQLPTDLQNGLVSQDTSGFVARSADDFTLPIGDGNNWQVNLLKGEIYLNPAEKIVPGAGYFEIYADGGGLPTGAPLYTIGADAANLTGNNFGLNIVEFGVGDGVTPLFTAAAGTKLWLSLVGSGTANFAYFCTFNFGGAPNGSPGAFIGPAFGVNNWQDANNQFGVQSDFAMAVEGRQVPAPAAAALLGLGGLAAARRRRA